MNDWQSWEPAPSPPSNGAGGSISPTQQRINSLRDARDLAAIIADLQDRVRALEVTPRLGNSSIENGTLDVIEDGVTTLAIGKQFDGTFLAAPLAGPIPPTPTPPTVTPVQGGLLVRWDGTFEGNQMAPMDFARVEVHTDTQAGFDPMLSENLRASITSPRGGEVLVTLPAETLNYVVLVTRAQTGKASDPSQQVGGTVPAAPGVSDGLPPASSPTPIVVGGIGVLFARWDPVPNATPVTYEVHLSDTAGFTPDASTVAGQIDGTLLALHNLPDGTPFTYGTTYYVRVVASDFDGPAPPSAEASGVPIQVTAPDIADAVIGMTKFASGIRPPRVVDALPASPYTGYETGDTVVLTTDATLYRFTGTGWTAGVDAADLNGVLADAQIASLAASKITGQLTDAQIAAIAAAKLTGQITGTQITDGAISTPKLAAGAVTAAQIAADTITAAELAAGAVTAAELAAGAVTAAAIAAGAITAGKIAAGAVSTDELAANAVTADKIAANSITAAQIAAGAVGAAQIAALAITADKIAADAITADKIAAGAVTAAELAAGAVTAAAIAASAITADMINTGTLRSSVTLSGEFKTSDTGQRAVMDAQGIHLFSATGSAPIVDLPVDPTKAAQFRGDAAMNNVSVGSKLTVASGSSGAAQAILADRVTAPAIGPGVVIDHEVGGTTFTNLPVPAGGQSAVNVRTACVVGTDIYLVCSATTATGAITNNLIKAPVDGGDPTGSWEFGTNVEIDGVAWTGSVIWLLVLDRVTDAFYARRYSTDFALVLDEVLLPNYRTTNTGLTRTNLMPNPSFETDTWGWTLSQGGSIARSTAAAYVGAACLALNANLGGYSEMSAGSGTSSFSWVAANVKAYAPKVTAGLNYAFSAYFRAAGATRNASITVLWADANGNSISSISSGSVTNASVAGSWTRLVVTGTAPAGAAYAVMFVKVQGPAGGFPANEVHYVDGVLVEQSSTYGAPYFDGGTGADSQSRTYWTGTANQSASVWAPFTYYAQGLAYNSTDGTLCAGFLRDDGTTNYPLEVASFSAANPHSYTPDVFAGPYTSAGAPGSRGFMVGAFDFGSVKILLNDNGNVKVYSFAGAGQIGLADPHLGFETSTDGGIGGKDPVFWNPNQNRFRQIRAQTTIAAGATKFGPVPWKRFSSIQVLWDNDIARAWWASYTWRDSDSGGTGLHETDQGLPTSFQMKNRYRLRLSAQAIPDFGGADDPNAVSFYLGTSPTWMGADPGRAAMYRQGGTLADGVTTLDLLSVVFSGNNPPDPANNPLAFPAAAPAYLESQKRRADGTARLRLDGGGAGRFDGLIPPGTIIMWPGEAGTNDALIPTGWVLCDGRAMSRALYPELAAACKAADGVTFRYGSGDGSTTFNVPNLKGRIPVGLDAADTGGTNQSFNQVGKTGGHKSMQIHSHGGGTGWVSADHSHNIGIWYQTNTTTTGSGTRLTNFAVGGNTANGGGTGAAGTTNNYNGTSGATANHWHGINNDGSGDSGNLQPFLVVNYLIKT